MRPDDGGTEEQGLNERARSLWARTRLHVWPERYSLVSLPLSALAEAASLAASLTGGFVVLLRERDEVSLTVPETAWAGSPLQRRAVAQAGPYRAITFDLDIALEVCGYLAPAAQRLAEAGIPIVPQCGYRKDHLLVLESQLATAVDVLEGLIGSCRS